jgi:two-component system, NtrC family, response regulator HydG
MSKFRFLILSPDAAGLALLTSMLKSPGHIIEEAANYRAATLLLERGDIDLVLARVDPSEGDVREWLRSLRPKHRKVPVILLCSRLHAERAREALRLGAVAVLKYPVPAAELRATVLQALNDRGVRPFETAGPTGTGANSSPASKPLFGPSAVTSGPALGLATGSGLHNVGKPDTKPTSVEVKVTAASTPASASPQVVEQLAGEIGLMGNDPSWRQILDLAGTIAATRASVLIVGEPGTGKSLLARLIHSLGPNPERPFITVEASAMADELATRETAEPSFASPPNLAPVWSDRLNPARGGTLYLADVAALPMGLQPHLLRELQSRDYEATSGDSTPHGEVRFLMSTADSLPDLVEQGRFSQELYHRISVISLMLPPLRHRGTADIELLAESFRARYAQEFHKSVTGFARDALDILQRHDWPGNVRELEGVIQRAVALCSGSRITSSHLAPILKRHCPARCGGSTPQAQHHLGLRSLKEALEEPEKQLIIRALQACNGNRLETARVLCINRGTLYHKMKRYGLFHFPFPCY